MALESRRAEKKAEQEDALTLIQEEEDQARERCKVSSPYASITCYAQGSFKNLHYRPETNDDGTLTCPCAHITAFVLTDCHRKAGRALLQKSRG